MKIKRNSIILSTLFFVLVVAISSCAKAECKTTSDCASKPCSLPKCESKKCVYTPMTNCCGNSLKEKLESGKPGNQCTCPQDYGKCEGKGKVKIGTRIEDAIYAHYYCNSFEQCVMGVESKDVTPQNFIDTISAGFFKASSVVRYNKPFDMSRDIFEFKIVLDDISQDLVLPVKLTNIRVLFSSDYSRAELLIAEKGLDNVLNNVGDFAVISTPLNLDYKSQEVEEQGPIRYTLDYTYTKKVPVGMAPDGSTLYKEELAREKFTAPPKQVFFVRSG